MRRAMTGAFMAACFTTAFVVSLRADHFTCKRFSDANIAFYNGATGDYYTAFQNEAIDDGDSWDHDTVISLTQVGQYGESDQINTINANYGNSGWVGLAEPGSCTAPYQIARANQYYLDNQNIFVKQFLACHELGHTLGLGHRGSGEDTCMRAGSETGTSVLFSSHYHDAQDVDAINNAYSGQ